MKKIVLIDGMTCHHCAFQVEKSLRSINGVTKARILLKKKLAELELNHEVSGKIIMDTVNKTGYKVLSIV
ncbi:MAG: heavy-metal-associated domain-containing protein [Spirochaetales bacterium]|nr:heavy-metal-associated domain-containing protein [Spirochaetales bacterium]